MKIKEVKAERVLDSRGEETILVSVKSEKVSAKTSSPSGKSTGKYEVPCYKKSLREDIEFVNKLDVKSFGEIKEFEDLEKIESKIRNKVGANTLFVLEASILKVLAKENNLSLWKFLNPSASFFPRLLSNTIGGGAHANSNKKTDFQEFLVVCNKNPSISRVVNNDAYNEARNVLKGLLGKEVNINDENAWISELSNEKTLEVMKEIQEDVFDETGTHIDIGLDCASSQFFKNGKYEYKNSKKILSGKEQVEYIAELIKKFNLAYVEDPLDEEDFKGFAELLKKIAGKCMIVGDDLTVTNLKRTSKAIKLGSINAMIIKPNQIGSLIEVKKVIDLCGKNHIRTIMSHRSGETLDDTISDLAFAWQCDFIKIPVVGKERLAKVDRLVEIEKELI